MAQIKKESVKLAVMQAAFSLFVQQGYAETQLVAIAKLAGTSKSNIYKYFGSKFEILMALYEPWLRQRVQRLAEQVLALPEPQRLRGFMRIFLEDIPQEDDGFANLLMQALATAPPDYKPDLLHWFESQLVGILRTCLGAGCNERQLLQLAELLVLVHDGFLIASRIKRTRQVSVGAIDFLCHCIER